MTFWRLLIYTYRQQMDRIMRNLYLFKQRSPDHQCIPTTNTFTQTCAPNEDSNQHAPPHSLIRIGVLRIQKLCILGYSIYVQWRFWSDCSNAQTDLIIRSAITKKCLYNFDPLKPHFYIVNLGFTVVYIVFLIYAEQEYENIRGFFFFFCLFVFFGGFFVVVFFSENFQFLVVKFSIYLNRCVACFHNGTCPNVYVFWRWGSYIDG